MSEKKDKAKTLKAYHDSSASSSSLLGSMKDGNSPISKLGKSSASSTSSSSSSSSASSSPSAKDKKHHNHAEKEKGKSTHSKAKDKDKDGRGGQEGVQIASDVDSEQLVNNRAQCDAGTACTSTDPLHWVQFQHTPRSPFSSASSHEVVVVSSPRGAERGEHKSGRKTPRGGKNRDRPQRSHGAEGDDGSSSEGSGVLGTVIVRSDSSGGGGVLSDDDYDDGECSGTMVIRDEYTLERLHSGDYDVTAPCDGEASSVIVHSSRSEVQPPTTNSPRPWLNKYRSPETWERNIIALEKGEFTEDMNEEAFGKYVRNKPRPSAQQLFVQLSSPALLASPSTSSSSDSPASPSSKSKKKAPSKRSSPPSSATSSPRSAPATPQ